MGKTNKNGKTGRTWKVMVLDDEAWVDPQLNKKIIHEQNRNDLYDALTYCLADVRITEYLYHLEVLEKLKRKLIKSTAMLGVSATSLVTVLSIFFGWWI